jgi:hypothetical protein
LSQIRLLDYTGAVFADSFNLGDDIQTLAVARLVPRVDGYVDRESLDRVDTPCTVPMNGYFMNTRNWPPSPAVRPVFYAFHLAAEAQDWLCAAPSLEYLRRWQPIGCRDRGTQALLDQHGIDTYYSRCISLTLPRREHEPEKGEVFLVGLTPAARQAVPKSLRRGAVTVDQARVRLPITNGELKRALAAELLEQYRQRARLVITSKIHCAMPCIAMGIPVVFLYDIERRGDYRVQLIDELVGIHYVHQRGALARLRNHWLGRRIDWSPQALDIEPLKAEIAAGFSTAFARVHGEDA